MPDTDPESPNPPAPETRTIPPTPPGWPATAWSDFITARDNLAGAKRMNETLGAKLGEVEQKAHEATERLKAVERERDEVRTRYAVDTALLRSGVTDPEDMAEFRERYGRVEPDAEGKRPAPDAWLTALKAKPPKWAVMYFTPQAPPKAETDPDAEVDEEPPVRVETRKAAVDPNAGARAGGADPAPRRWTPKRVEASSPREIRDNLGSVLAEAEARGEIVLNESIRKRFAGGS